MVIAQLSDTHILSPESDLPAANLRATSLERCVEAILRDAPDAVILTGDTVQHGRPDEYARLRELLAPLQAPLYVVPGNRDDSDEMRRAFDDLPYFGGNEPFLHYAIDDFEVRLVGIDSTLRGERKGHFCEARQAWLDATLAGQPESATLLFIHHPPFDVGQHYVGGYRNPGEAAALQAIVERHPQIIGLLCGHVHWPVAREWAGTQARIMPSVAIDVRKGVDETAAAGRPLFMLHRLTTENGLSSESRFADAAA